MNKKKLAKTVKKLIYSNRFTLVDISNILDIPVDDCINAFESQYKTPIPASLLVVGNKKARQQLVQHVKNAVPTLLVGPNGTGKDIAIREIANDLKLEIKKCVPLNQADLILSFGKGPLYNNNNFLYVVDVDSLPKKTYSVLLKYVTLNLSPIILIAINKNNLNKKISKTLEIVSFAAPSPIDIADFLKDKYNWEGDIRDIYDEDMRVVINRALSGKEILSVKQQEPINSTVMAMNISCGFAKVEDFDRCKEPLWWVLRWLAYNQRKKHRTKNKQIDNLRKLSRIDNLKFKWNEEYLKAMLLDIHKSPVRSRFSFPPWPKKRVVVEAEAEKMKKPTQAEKKEAVLKQIDFTKWL